MDDNVANEGVISTAASRVGVRVIHMDEEQMFAHSDSVWPVKKNDRPFMKEDEQPVGRLTAMNRTKSQIMKGSLLCFTKPKRYVVTSCTAATEI